MQEKNIYQYLNTSYVKVQFVSLDVINNKYYAFKYILC